MNSFIIAILLIGGLIVLLVLTSILNRKTGSSDEYKGFKGNCETCGQTSCSLHPNHEEDNEEE